jgi:hypothetical protein
MITPFSKYNDPLMQELLKCDGNARCVLAKLDELSLYSCEFTLEEIGHILNITRERVRQIEASAIKKLKHPKVGRLLLMYLKL